MILENVCDKLQTVNFQSKNGVYEVRYQDGCSDEPYRIHSTEVEAFSAQAAIRIFAIKNQECYVVGVEPTF